MQNRDGMIQRGDTVRSTATFVVAASNSPHHERADIVCDPDEAQVGLAEAFAMNLENEYAGTIHCMPGYYEFTAPLYFIEKFGNSLEGEWGRRSDMFPTPATDHKFSGGTAFCLADEANCNMFELPESLAHLKYQQISNIICVGNRDNQSQTSHCLNIEGSISDSVFDRVVIMGFNGDGWHIDPGANASHPDIWHVFISRGWIEHNNANAFFYDGTRSGTYFQKLSINNIHFIGNGCDFNLREYGSQHGSMTVQGCHLQDGIQMFNAAGCSFVNNNIKCQNSSPGVITDTSVAHNSNHLFEANHIIAQSGQAYLSTLPTNTYGGYFIMNNVLHQLGSAAARPFITPAASVYNMFTIRDNIGFVTENSGTDTITTDIKVVAHGLDITPVAGDIMVTPLADIAPATRWWIDTYSDTSFTLHLDQAPAASALFAFNTTPTPTLKQV
jgi:hypothetical protein